MIRRDAPFSSLLSQLPWLLDANCWAFETGPGRPDRLATPFPLGNGRIFALAGAAPPGTRLSALTGPTYGAGRGRHAGGGDDRENGEGAFGDCWLDLTTERGEVALPCHEVWRPRETGVLVTRSHDRTVSLVTIDYAPPGRALLLRVVEVWRGDRLGANARLQVRLPRGDIHDDRRRSLRVTADSGAVLILTALASGRRAYPGRIEIPLPEVPASGGVQRVTLALVAGRDQAGALDALPQMLHPVTLLEQTRSFWKIWLGRTRTPDLWPQNFPGPTSTIRSLADLLEAGKIALKMQQAHPGGAVGSPAAAHGIGARGATGPVRALLAIGARDEAQDFLEYQYRCAIALGRIPDAAPLDLDVVGAGELSDWTAVPPPGPSAAAALVLQHRWWLEAGGDVELVRRHWDYLGRCAAGQRTTVDGLLAVPLAEPDAYAALSALFPHRAGWPNDLVGAGPPDGYRPLPLDTMTACAAAHEAMARMAEPTGHGEEAAPYAREAERARGAVERGYWLEKRGYYGPALYPLSGVPHQTPLAPVNVLPLWVGYHGPEEYRGRQNLDAVVDLVGFRGSTPDCEHFLGAAPAYLVWSLATAGADLAPLALANLVALATPAGDWAGLYGPGGEPAAPGTGPDRMATALEAIYRYFTVRDAAEEPEYDLRGVTRGGKTYGPGPIRSFKMGPSPPPGRIIVMTVDEADLAQARAAGAPGEGATVIEPAWPFGPDYLAQLLFDPVTGERRVDALVLGASAVAGDQRSMKPAAFWHLPEVASALERFAATGGRLLRPG